MKKPRITLLIIILITFLALVLSWPTTPLDFSVGLIKIDTVLSHPKVDVKFLGLGFKRDFEPKLGLDLQGGVDLTLRADVSDLEEGERDEALNAAKEIIERRVNALGAAEPIVQTSRVSDEYRIIVELPGLQNVEEAKKLVGQTAKIEFREFKNEKDAVSFASARNPLPSVENTKPTGIDGRDLKKALPDFQSAGAA